MTRVQAPRGRRGGRPARPETDGTEAWTGRLAAALEAGGLGVWEIDFVTRRLALSVQARALLGLRDDEPATLRAAWGRVDTEDRLRLRTAVRACRSAPAPVEVDLRLQVRDPDGAARWIAVRGRVVDDEAIGVMRDVTEREELLRQKDALMVELNHRTKNSLQLVASLLRLESRDIRDPEGRRRFAEASTRVNSIAAVHDGLDRTADLKRVRLGPLVRRLCDDLAHLLSRDDRVAVSIGTDAAIDTDRAIPLAIILNELVTNALKYGRRDGDAASASVSLDAAPPGSLVLTVADAGPGLPGGFSMERPPGLGLQLVTALTRQIGGQVEAVATGRGAAFRVRFPLER